MAISLAKLLSPARQSGDASSSLLLRSLSVARRPLPASRRFRVDVAAQVNAGEGGGATASASERDAGAGATTRHQAGHHSQNGGDAQANGKSHGQPGRSSHRLKGGCTIEELTTSARVAKLADFIYSPDLPGPVTQEGYTFITEGYNKHTRWFLADETRPDGRITRHIIMRGVVWANDQVDRVSLMQRVANVWPRHLSEGSRILCHSGVLSIAEEVWEAVLPYVRGRPRDSQLSFAGHSLGGSLALLLTAFARTRLGIPPEGLLPTHMFGSPPVLSLTTADTATGQSAKLVHDGHEILRELQLPDSAVRWFVADQDLIPRLWNAADPMYAYARRSSALVRVLEWREQVFGGPMLTADKFLYDMLGRIYWLKWPRNEGVKVLLMTPEQAEVELKEHPEDVIQPTALFRSAMDHSRRNYSFALETLVMLHRRGV